MAKRKSFLTDGELTNAPLEENPEITHRKRIAKENAENQKGAESVETYYRKEGYKVSKITRMSSGNAYSSYVGSIKNKEVKEFWEKAKADGLTRVE